MRQSNLELATSQHFLDALDELRIHPVLSGDHLLDNLPRTIDDVGLGQLEGAVVRRDIPGRVPRHLERNRKLLQELMIKLFVLIDAHTQDHHAFGRELAAEYLERRNLLDAGLAPGSPEV